MLHSLGLLMMFFTCTVEEPVWVVIADEFDQFSGTPQEAVQYFGNQEVVDIIHSDDYEKQMFDLDELTGKQCI